MQSRINCLPVVKPGNQSQRFTHIDDTVEVCYKAWKKIDVNIIVYQIKSYTILSVAKLFKFKIKLLL